MVCAALLAACGSQTPSDPAPAPTASRESTSPASLDTPCPSAHPSWLRVDPARVTALPGDEIAFTARLSEGAGRLSAVSPWAHAGASEDSTVPAATVVASEPNRGVNAVQLLAQGGAHACVQPEITLVGETIEGHTAEERRDVTAIRFVGAVVTVHGRELSLSFSDGTEEVDCGHHVVPVAHHWLRESPDTARLYVAVEDRRGNEDCSDQSVTPRVLVTAPIPAEVEQVHVIFDLADFGTSPPRPYLRHERTLPVRDATQTLEPR